MLAIRRIRLTLNGVLRSVVLSLLCILIVDCQTPDTGHLEAFEVGNVLHPPAVRVEGDTRFDCDPAGDVSTDVMRAPYLQLVGPNEATVVWTTRGATDAIVEVSLPGGDVVTRAEAIVMPTTELEVGAQVEARLAGLAPATAYCYSVVDGSGTTIAGPFGLRTAPPDEDPGVVRIGVLGDSGSGDPDQLAVAAQFATVPMNLFLHTGDVAYPSGTLPELEATFFDVYEPIIRSVPSYLSPGNHDYRTAGGAPFREVFVLPENGGPEGEERWYSFDWGPLHVVTLDSESDLAPQVDWLVDDLERNTRPWIIVQTHWGPYSSGSHGSNGAMRAAFRPIFERYGVHLVVSGHDHHYERTRPIGNITYIVTGGGGGGTRTVTPSDWTAFSLDVLHFLYITIEGDSMRVHAIDGTGQEFDGTEIPLDRDY